MKYKTIWIVGSSIVKHAFVRARSTKCTHLDLKRYGASILWQGQSGLRWTDLEGKVNQLLKFEDPPDFLVIHCGGNDIGIGPKKSILLRKRMERTIINISLKMPHTRMVWSQILPRYKWRSSLLQEQLDKIRVRLNSRLATLILSLGGASIKYPELDKENVQFLQDDRVHLTDLGNDIMLYRIQQAFQTFLTSNVSVSPPTGESGPWLYLA